MVKAHKQTAGPRLQKEGCQIEVKWKNQRNKIICELW